MDAKGDTKTGEGQIIKFKKTEDSEEIFLATTIPTHPYVIFTDTHGIKIKGTGYKSGTAESQGKTEELRESAIDFINDKGRIIIK